MDSRVYRHFVIDPPQQPVPELAQEHRHVLLPPGDIRVFMVVLLQFDTERIFKDPDEFGDIDIAVVDRAGGLERVDQLDGVGLGGGPLGGPERLEEGFRRGLQPGQLQVQVGPEVFVGDDLAELIVVGGRVLLVLFEILEFGLYVKAAPGIVGLVELAHAGAVIAVKGAVTVEKGFEPGQVHLDVVALDGFAARRALQLEVIDIDEINEPAVEPRLDLFKEKDLFGGAAERMAAHVSFEFAQGFFADQQRAPEVPLPGLPDLLFHGPVKAGAVMFQVFHCFRFCGTKLRRADHGAIDPGQNRFARRQCRPRFFRGRIDPDQK